MRTINARQLVFALMVFSVAACGFAYAGNSTPWAGSALSVLPTASTPAPPIVSAGTTTPTTMLLQWHPDMRIAGVATPDHYQVDIDGATEAVQLAVPTERLISGLVPGSTHVYQILGGRTGFFGAIMWSDPGSLSVTQPKAPVSLGKPSVPRSGKTKRAVKFGGTVSSVYPVPTSSVVELKFYRLQKRGRKSVWVLRKTVTAARSDANSYAASLRLKPTGTWSVVAESIGDDTHTAAKSDRSKSFKMK